MQPNSEEFAVLLEGINAYEAGMVRSLLDAAGIPSLAHGPDFDIAELGLAAHDVLRGTNILVPHTALESAKQVLEESGWYAQQEED